MHIDLRPKLNEAFRELVVLFREKAPSLLPPYRDVHLRERRRTGQ